MGFSSGNVMSRKARQRLAPSIDAASSNSLETWVSPANRVIATKGIAPQTISEMITPQPLQGFASQSWWLKFPTPSLVSVQLATPNSKSIIQDQIEMATTTGVAQTKIRPAVRSSRTQELSSARSKAMSVASTTVSTTETTVTATVLSRVCQKTLSWKIAV